MDTKYNIIKTKGIILKTFNIKEYDKSLVILTDLFGKISIVSFGSKRQKSKNLSKTRIFTFGNFEIKIVNNKYVLENFDVMNYFDDLTKDIYNYSYGSYFLEVLNYITFEGIEYNEQLNLIYYSLLALNKNIVDKNLVLSIFRLKCLQYEGISIDSSFLPNNVDNTIKYTWQFVLNNNGSKLFTFTLRDDLLSKFNLLVEDEFNKKFNYNFKSLNIINKL